MSNKTLLQTWVALQKDIHFLPLFLPQSQNRLTQKEDNKHVIGVGIKLMILMKNDGRKRMISNKGARKYSTSSFVMIVFIGNEYITCFGLF